MSAELKAAGTAALARGQWLEAVGAFSRLLAEGGAPAAALDGRSGVLAGVGRWRDAARDAERALAAPDCPPERRLRLQLRLANCLRRLRQPQSAQLEYQAARQMILSNDLPEDIEQQLLAAAERSFNSDSAPKAIMPQVEYAQPPQLSYGESAQLPQFSAAVRVEQDEIFGRKVVADRDLISGDVILVELPALSNLKNDAEWLHCGHCYQLCLNLMPCEGCRKVMFCSDECLCAALKGQHGAACAALVRYQELKKGLNLSEDMFANFSRVIDFVSTFGVQHLLEYASNDTHSNNLVRYLDLCWHRTDQEHRITAMCARIVSYCFQLSEKEVQKVAPLCCRMVLIDQANSYSIEHALLLPGEAMETRHVAYATYLGAALMNHSCDPNVVSSFHLKSLALRVTRPVSKGEQLFNRYCNTFYNMPKDMRQTRLRSFNFECACAACTLGWPVAKLLPELEPPVGVEAASLLAVVKTALANCAAADGRGVNFRQVSDDQLHDACKRLQCMYFEPELRTRLDKNYRALELLMYYFYSAKTVLLQSPEYTNTNYLL